MVPTRQAAHQARQTDWILSLSNRPPGTPRRADPLRDRRDRLAQPRRHSPDLGHPPDGSHHRNVRNHPNVSNHRNVSNHPDASDHAVLAMGIALSGSRRMYHQRGTLKGFRHARTCGRGRWSSSLSSTSAISCAAGRHAWGSSALSATASATRSTGTSRCSGAWAVTGPRRPAPHTSPCRRRADAAAHSTLKTVTKVNL